MNNLNEYGYLFSLIVLKSVEKTVPEFFLFFVDKLFVLAPIGLVGRIISIVVILQAEFG